MAAELAHVRVVLGQNGDGVALLPDDEPGLLLCGAPQVDAIELGNTENGLSKERRGHGGGPGTQKGKRGNFTPLPNMVFCPNECDYSRYLI